jgi:hypothetical protein
MTSRISPRAQAIATAYWQSQSDVSIAGMRLKEARDRMRAYAGVKYLSGKDLKNKEAAELNLSKWTDRLADAKQRVTKIAPTVIVL